jgi:flavodoxin long chain
MATAIVYGSNTGVGQGVADDLKELLGDRVDDVLNIAEIEIDKILEYDKLILGISTWDIGELQYDWADKAAAIPDKDWAGKTIAFFGMGDAAGYPDTFVDAIGMVWAPISQKGAKLVGKVPVDGYEFESSRALCDNGTNFVGLPLDNDNEAEMTEERLAKWADQLKSEMFGE